MAQNRLRVVAAVVTGLLASNAHAQPIIAKSTFDTDLQGWSIRTNNNACSLTTLNASNATWITAGGNPGGYAQHVDPSESRTAYWRSPTSFQDDVSAAYGGTLEFDLRQSPATGQYNEFDVVLSGGGLTLMFDTAYNPRTTWTHFQVPIRVGTGWRVGTCNGPLATEVQLRQALAGVTQWLVRTEFRMGGDTDGMDNITLYGPPALPSAPSSDFETSSEGWWVIADAVPSWDMSAGVPGGCLRGDDNAAGVLYAFVAPAKYLGDRSSLIGSTLRLDFREPSGGLPPEHVVREPVQRGHHDFVRGTRANRRERLASPRHPARAPCPGWVRSGNTPATPQDFADVLGSLSFFSVRGEFRDGDEVEFMDNVLLGSCEPSAYVSGPVCASGTLTLTVATGGAPSTYAWRANGIVISPAANPTATTSVLSMVSGPELDDGPYDCVVTNSCGSVTSNAVVLIACCDPIDFNADGVFPDSGDIADYLSVFGGGTCSNDPNCGGGTNDIDFNNDGVSPDSADIESILRVFGGGDC